MSEPRLPFGANSKTEEIKPRRRFAALWERFSKDANKESYFTGELTLTKELMAAFETAQVNKYGDKVVDIVVFKNKDKTADNQPDYRILIGKPKE